MKRSRRSIGDIVRDLIARRRLAEDPLFVMEALFDAPDASGADHDRWLYGAPTP